MEVVTKNAKETEKLGEKIAKLIVSKKIEKRILALKGELGGGKTTFLKGLAEGLGIKEKILSPTFVLMKKFKIPLKKSKFKTFYHFDFYRIKKQREISNLKFKKIVEDPKNIVAIEWAEKVKNVLPKETLLIEFHLIDQKTRKIIFENL